MQDHENKETNVKSTIDAVTGLVSAIPIYQDAIQPSAKQIGKSLETVTKTVNIALSPIKALVWGYEKIEEFITSKVSEKLKNVSEENIVSPPTSIAGPTVEALRFAGDDINLRELYANLLASSMDKTTQDLIHPGYVEIIKNLSSDEALLLQAFKHSIYHPLIDISAKLPGSQSKKQYSNFSHFYKIINIKRPDLIPSYLDNIIRLGLAEIPFGSTLLDPNIYEPLEDDSELDLLKFKITNELKATVRLERKYIILTAFGRLFVQNIVIDKNENI
ncbi:DUF4393 domain-containing protein [Flavobacterium hercynium]|uniref:DUF4393 domain-containing protein n=1 Tax=Flavobacterium hercynium TaxID=387094 RepID=A0A226HLY1_9FLAO|nr:DUF4393 domain-containing protein [Flavobacterium hercynium]OXA95205.1 hypothetical protein B0A66_02960 [Flavobacterium hercynium]SMP15070.1 protein of unknown function [Flavobacterium hercynium]